MLFIHLNEIQLERGDKCIPAAAHLSRTILGPVLPVLSSCKENVLSSFCLPGNKIDLKKIVGDVKQGANLLLSRFLARAMAHLLRESLNSILTPSLTRCGTLGSSSMMAYSSAEPRNWPVNWLDTRSSSSPLVLAVDLMMVSTMSAVIELDSRFRARSVLLD